MNYALHEALRLVLEEGLENRWRRHEQKPSGPQNRLGRNGSGTRLATRPSLWSLNAIRVPEGADEAAVRKKLLSEFNIEIGAGLGPLKGKIWRVGLMGENSRRENVDTFLSALKTLLG